ncbi:hypothetical protein [Agrobacterium tumefaciens]|uniref:hypothetical protein n=1 Tax=Agrobacterium tumefaciens TaxID=358 RepID=UPI0021D3B601|nr:hypothetical protein [Agrobacterium tumefaciens]UXS23091.1 hypothetical protein FY153_00985 [Agrobacterium tumefaciens]
MNERSKPPALDDGSELMQISAPKVKYELNMTTAVVTIGLCATFAGWGVVWGSLTTRIENGETRVNGWITSHEQLHKDRLVAVTATETRTDQRIQVIEAEQRKIDNLSYRLTVQEQGAATLSKNVEELKAAVQGQSADLRVIREILTRMDPRNDRLAKP